jgi:3-hydroxyisobutyrate dehydrogenase-like beta-hydroxyacid dehydrogenase
MTLTIALAAPGQMGSSLGARLNENGLEVVTLLEGRSPATIARAQAAGMAGVSIEAFVARDVVLSVVPPNEAMPLAERVAAAAREAGCAPVYVDCNAVSPATTEKIARVIEAAGMSFVDGSIIGMPARPGYSGPALFVSGPHAWKLRPLVQAGIDLRILDAPVGAASALKMCYGGLTKGLIALGSMMILAAHRAGATDALRDELALSQPQLFASFSRSIPDMFSKAGRWVPEMNEIASFLGEGSAENDVYSGLAAFYGRLARASDEIDQLRSFFETPPKTGKTA